MRSPELETAIETLYAEFRVPAPRAIAGCPCCTDQDSVCRLLTKGLRELTSADLSDYAASLFLTMGDEEDFKYFLPRLVDIATAEDWWPTPEVLLGKLTLARWVLWPSHKRATVTTVIDLWYANYLGVDQPDGPDIDALLCGIGRAGLPLRPYLDQLASRPDALAAFFEVNALAYFKRKELANAFWNECPAAHAAVIEFLESPAVRKQLQLG